jgi:hypothetical protein
MSPVFRARVLYGLSLEAFVYSPFRLYAERDLFGMTMAQVRIGHCKSKLVWIVWEIQSVLVGCCVLSKDCDCTWPDTELYSSAAIILTPSDRRVSSSNMPVWILPRIRCSVNTKFMVFVITAVNLNASCRSLHLTVISRWIVKFKCRYSVITPLPFSSLFFLSSVIRKIRYVVWATSPLAYSLLVFVQRSFSFVTLTTVFIENINHRLWLSFCTVHQSVKT